MLVSGVSLYVLAVLDGLDVELEAELELVLLDVLALDVVELEVLVVVEDLCVELELLAGFVPLVPDLELDELAVPDELVPVLVFGAELWLVLALDEDEPLVFEDVCGAVLVAVLELVFGALLVFVAFRVKLRHVLLKVFLCVLKRKGEGA